MTDSSQISVLVVDDEAPNIDSLRRIFEREGFSVEVLDANCPPELPGQLLIDEIERRSPAIVGITLFTPDLGTFGELLPEIRRLLDQGVIGHLVLGGHHPSYQPEATSGASS